MLVLREVLRWVAVWCVAAGVGVLIVRFLAARSVAPLWVIGGGVLVAILAVFRVRVPSRRAMVALVDAHSGAGGLVMAAEDADVGAWKTEIAALPRVRWDARRAVALALTAAGFAAATLLVPIRAAATQNRLEIAADVERLEGRVDLLKEEKVIDDQRAAAMEKSLAELKEETAGDDPAKAWETLDSIAEATERAAREAAESAMQQSEQLARAEAMATALDEAALDPAQVAAGMSELAEEMRKAEAQSKDVLGNLPPEVREAIAKNAISDKQLKQLADAARQGKDALRKQLQKLSDAGLIDPKTLRQLEQAADSANARELQQFLKDNPNQKSMAKALDWLGEEQGEGEGRGPIQRGRNDAPMYFGIPTKEAGAEFKEQTLPPSSVAALQNSELVAVSAGAPTANDAQRSHAGALNNAAAGGGSAFTPTVMPRHRGTVRRYFERKPK